MEILGEDFDSLLQYNDPSSSPLPTPTTTTLTTTPPQSVQQGKSFADKTTLKKSILSPQLYHHHYRPNRHHGDLDHRHSEQAVSTTESPSLAKGSFEATQLSHNPTKTSAKCDSVSPTQFGPPMNRTKRDNVLIEEGDSGALQKELSERFSSSVDAELASCNNHNPSYMSHEATQVLPNGGACDSVCTFSNSNSSAGASVENIMSAAVQLDLPSDSETTTSDSGHCDGDECASTAGDELGAVDLDSFASKELADLLQELRRSLLVEEGGSASGDGSRALQIKRMPKIGEIDEFIEDGLPLDLVEELDRNAHQFSSSM